MSDFNWQLIPSFLAAHQHGSLLGAARALGISQPTVGRHVTLLETQLGTPLFERTGRGLAPTPATTGCRRFTEVSPPWAHPWGQTNSACAPTT